MKHEAMAITCRYLAAYKVSARVTLADDRQRHADDWQSVEMAALTARRVVDMIAELSQGSLVWPGGPWRSRLSVGAKISDLETAAATSYKRPWVGPRP